jgi:ribosomal protein L11 methyltransferase
MIELFPEGFAEERQPGSVVLSAFTDEAGAARLKEAFGEVATEVVPEGWEDEWKRFHRPVEVGSLWIGPPWETPPAAGAVVIDPGRAFGTGGHATTRLCLELLHVVEPASLLDVGCGSGVLAIAAARLGFDPVVAVDADGAAVEATVRNALANDVRIDARRLDARVDPLPEAEVVVANVDFATVSALQLSAGCRVLITSGYLEGDEPAYSGFERAGRRTQAEWAADLFVRQ